MESELENPLKRLLEERSPHKVAGIYAQHDAARDARHEIVVESGMTERQVRVLSPQAHATDLDTLFREIEPQGGRRPWLLVRTHLVLGTLGAIIGVGVFVIAWALDSPRLQSAPVAGLLVFAFLAAVVGMLIAGLVSLRPDERVLATRLQTRLRHGQWAAIAHPVDHRQSSAARRVLDRSANLVIRTL